MMLPVRCVEVLGGCFREGGGQDWGVRRGWMWRSRCWDESDDFWVDGFFVLALLEMGGREIGSYAATPNLGFIGNTVRST